MTTVHNKHSGDKLPFNIDEVMDRVREGVRPYPSAVLFGLADEGYGSVPEQTVECLSTVRTLEETSALATRRLFARAPQVLHLPGAGMVQTGRSDGPLLICVKRFIH